MFGNKCNDHSVSCREDCSGSVLGWIGRKWADIGYEIEVECLLADNNRIILG